MRLVFVIAAAVLLAGCSKKPQPPPPSQADLIPEMVARTYATNPAGCVIILGRTNCPRPASTNFYVTTYWAGVQTNWSYRLEIFASSDLKTWAKETNCGYVHSGHTVRFAINGKQRYFWPVIQFP